MKLEEFLAGPAGGLTDGNQDRSEFGKRICIRRNISGFHFPEKLSMQERQKVLSEIQRALDADSLPKFRPILVSISQAACRAG